MISESTDIRFLKGVGEKRAEKLHKLGIFNVGELLRYYPRDYRDLSKVTEIKDAVTDEKCCIKAIVGKNAVGARIRKGLTIYKTEVTDGTGVLEIIIYNSKFAAQALKEGEEYFFYGKISGNFIKKEMSAPEIFKSTGNDISVHPIYSLTQGINSKYLEKLVIYAFSAGISDLKDPIPKDIREKLCLMKIEDALREIHFPQNEDMLSEAKRRLIFEELFVLQSGLIRFKGNEKKQSNIVINKIYTEEFYSTLPFEPTEAQKRAVSDCTEQIQSGVLMNRLIQGDVGSGKTLVACAVIYNMAKNGYQSAFMAPTEILASQHFKTLKGFFDKSDINIALLTGSTSAKEKREIKEKIKNGEIDVAIGTHALIQSDVVFKNIGLVITDEQHRFGVKQRSALTAKGNTPHTLVMSATPIPRTLALMIYGDLDISVIDQMPAGRQPIETYLIDSKKRQRAYNYIKKHLDEGRQAYIVCPLVEENEDLGLASAERFAQELSSKTFASYSVGLLHGKMKAKEKDAVMTDFAKGKIRLLVATTVIEVGIDVPNAVIMLIENAERFGLSQLHQLRGRIGRGKYKSTCILVSDAKGETSQKRLKIMTETCDGFKIANEDLEIRGPGDFFGDRQHGLPELKIAMLTDSFTLNEAYKFAREVYDNDPPLIKEENKDLKIAVKNLFDKANVLN